MINTVLLDLYGIIYPDRDGRAKDFISKLKEMGVQIIAVTNLGSDAARRICADHLIVMSYVCREIGLTKTDPELYEQIVQDNELNPQQVVMLDDTCANLAAAREAGIMAVYLGDGLCPTADKVINSLEAFITILGK